MASNFTGNQESCDIQMQPMHTGSRETHTSQPDVHCQPDSVELAQVSYETLNRIDQERIQQVRHLNILITGKTGCGKSTIVNGILGLEDNHPGAAEEGHDISKPCTTKVEEFTAERNGIKVRVWDTPGLQDGRPNQQEYIDEIERKCSNTDLTLYCINVSTARFVPGDDNQELVAMKKLTDKFGTKFWTNAVIILTFANALEVVNPDWADLEPDEKTKAFKEKIRHWKKLIRKYLHEYVEVIKEIADHVTIIPAGHYRVRKLFDLEYWFSDLWFGCLNAIPSPEKRSTFYYLNHDRIRKARDITEEELTKTLREQPIILNDEQIEQLREAKKLGRIIGGVLGALGGPLMPVTIPVGVVAGKWVGKRIAQKKILSAYREENVTEQNTTDVTEEDATEDKVARMN